MVRARTVLRVGKKLHRTADAALKQKGEKNWEFNGPKGGGYYVLDEEGRPVTRRRGTPLYRKDR